MRYRFTLLVFSALAVVTLWSVYRSTDAKLGAQRSSVKVRSPETLNSFFHRPRPYRFQSELLKPSERSCALLWNLLLSLDLSKLASHPPEVNQVPALGRCQPESESLVRAHKRFGEYCAGFGLWARQESKKLWREKSNQCYTSVLFYRGKLARYWKQTHPIPTTERVQLFLSCDLFVSALAENDVALATESAHRMLTLEHQWASPLALSQFRALWKGIEENSPEKFSRYFFSYLNQVSKTSRL